MRAASIAVAFFLLVSPHAAARADDVADCTSTDAARRIRGCSALLTIENKPAKDVAIVYNNRGLAFFEQKDYERALFDFRKSILLDSRNADAFVNRGLVYMNFKKYNEAILDFGKAISLNPSYYVPYFNRGIAHSNGNQFDLALSDFNKAISLKPDLAVLYSNRAFVLNQKRQYVRAIDDCNIAIGLAPNLALAWLNRGIANGSLGNIDQSIIDLEKAVELDPSLSNAKIALSEVLRLKANQSVSSAVEPSSVAAVNANPLSRTPADAICRLALTNDSLSWDERYEFAVIEAKRRNLTVESCRAALGNVPKTLATVDVQSDTALRPHLSRRIALVIGNTAYQSVPHLPNAVNDAELAGSALRKAGFDDVTIETNLDRSDMVRALQEFGLKADRADWAVVYYAGHGIEVGGRNFLIPVDAKLKQERHVEDEAIALDRVLTSAEGARTIRLIALDACRDNPFEVQMKSEKSTRSVGRGLARVEPDSATLVLFAAKEGTTAADGDGRNSPFAAAFARRIVEPGVEINFVIRRLQADVVKATSSRQQPVLYGNMPLQELFFVQQ